MSPIKGAYHFVGGLFLYWLVLAVSIRSAGCRFTLLVTGCLYAGVNSSVTLPFQTEVVNFDNAAFPVRIT